MPHFQALRDKLKALPVHGIVDEVVKDIGAGIVTIVAASTGSGKSMLVPATLADALGEPVVVLVPRRFLAIDAAHNVAELSGTDVGDKVGYALGQIDGESSRRSPSTQVLYCTYGYALSSGLINRARTIVLDEVHEADEHISLSRAILRLRKTSDPALRIAEMSATVEPDRQASFWKSMATAKVHLVVGQALACAVTHEPISQGRVIEEIAVGILAAGRKGIAVFRAAVKEVEDSVVEIKKLLEARGETKVEVVAIHGGTPSDQRRIARRAPAEGMRKVIVGTNVIESGVNLRWVDAGVSDGDRKVPYHREDTGADALVREDQPQSGLLQQIGRINRDPVHTGFDQGAFILHAKRDFDLRLPQNTPAIQRQSLLGVAFYAASLGYDPAALTWDITERQALTDLPTRFERAKQDLMRLQLINDHWALTPDAGAFVARLPVSPEVGAMLWEAKQQDDQRLRAHEEPRVMRDMVLIAAILESHGLRQDGRKNHASDQHKTSDLIDGMNAFRRIRQAPCAQAVIDATEAILDKISEDEQKVLEAHRVELQSLCAKNNVSVTGFVEVARLAQEITKRLTDSHKGIRIDARKEDEKYDAKRYGELQRCILSGHVNRVFIHENGGLRDLMRDFGKQRSDAGRPFNGYAVSDYSIIKAKDGMIIAGALREMPLKQKDQLPELVLTNASIIPAEVFVAWVADRQQSHCGILTKAALTADGALDAAYDGKARFEILVPHDLLPKIKTMVAGIAELESGAESQSGTKRSRP